MANLPPTEQIDVLACEIYDELCHQDSTLIWLSPEEELPTLNQPDESSNNFSLDPQDVCELESMVFDCALGEQPGISSDPSSSIHVQLLLPQTLGPGGSVEIPGTSSPLTYKPLAQFNLSRWLFRLGGLVSILLIGSMLPQILEHMQPTRLKSSTTLAAPSTSTQGAEHTKSGAVRVLTVMAGPEETVKGISLRYVGYFDDDLFREISKLNPNLKDFNHLEDGQLIRIPLRALPRLID